MKMKALFDKKTGSFLVLFVLLMAFPAIAQETSKEDKKESTKYMQEAEKSLSENDFASAEASYRKAIAKDPSNTTARYNMGNLYYTKEKSNEAETKLSGASKTAVSKEEKHRVNHNLGNSYMKQKKYQNAVNAYKEALRYDPNDDETRYNLALAKKMLEQQQKNQDKNKDKNQDKNQDKKDQDKKNKDGQGGDDKKQDGDNKDKGDQGKDNKDNKDGKGDQDKKDQGDKQDKDKNKQDKGKPDQKEGNNGQNPQQPKPGKGQLSQQQIKNLLEAMNNEEKKVQDKINAEKARGVKVRSEKDW